MLVFSDKIEEKLFEFEKIEFEENISGKAGPELDSGNELDCDSLLILKLDSWTSKLRLILILELFVFELFVDSKK